MIRRFFRIFLGRLTIARYYKMRVELQNLRDQLDSAEKTANLYKHENTLLRLKIKALEKNRGVINID